MPLKVIEPRRLYLEIAGQIRKLIQSGEFQAGSRLPSERELSDQFRVSRPSVREALIALELEGYVDIRPGSGIFVTKPKFPTPDLSQSEGPLEIVRARTLIEGEIAAVAATRITKRDLHELSDLIEQMRQDQDPETFTSADRSFHVLIVRKLENDVLLRIVTDLFDQRHGPLAMQFIAHFESARSRAAAIAEHQKILQGLASKNPELARRAMSSHLKKSHSRWTRALKAGKKS